MTRTLILIPTELEREILQPLLEPALSEDDHVELCGFGLVAAASLTAQLIADHRPTRVILVGIAGTFSDHLPVGAAAVFDEVSCCGIGAGSGAEHQTIGDMGWHHVGGRMSDRDSSRVVITDTIELHGANCDSGLMGQSAQLLSVASASGSLEDAAIRRRRFPRAAAEDMEGFAVGMACQLAEIPVAIVRGISNQVGDRNVANWQIKPALEAAAGLVTDINVY